MSSLDARYKQFLNFILWQNFKFVARYLQSYLPVFNMLIDCHRYGNSFRKFLRISVMREKEKRADVF